MAHRNSLKQFGFNSNSFKKFNGTSLHSYIDIFHISIFHAILICKSNYKNFIFHLKFGQHFKNSVREIQPQCLLFKK